ncbi:uncharacterized protein LOC135195265 [Macrobrachium nipponense]|uniref:uncharacterized protein LOC135195265 n=1 Tax=Macrobrachium nipponense TaxID=159736 RepID=UPI0030C86871
MKGISPPPARPRERQPYPPRRPPCEPRIDPRTNRPPPPQTLQPSPAEHPKPHHYIPNPSSFPSLQPPKPSPTPPTPKFIPSTPASSIPALRVEAATRTEESPDEITEEMLTEGPTYSEAITQTEEKPVKQVECQTHNLPTAFFKLVMHEKYTNKVLLTS